MRYIIILSSVFFFVLNGLAQGGNENTIMNNSAPVINSNNTFNSNSIQGNFILADTISTLIIEDQDAELKEVNTTLKKISVKKVDVKNKMRVQEVEKEEVLKEKNSSNALQQLNQIQGEIRHQSNQRSPTPQQQFQLNRIVQELKKQDSTSFEFNMNYYLSGNYNVELKDYLYRAATQNPTDANVLKQSAALAVIESDTVELLKNLELQVKQGILGSDFIAYGSDLLVSAKPNGTLITHSFEDTYAAMYNQLKLNKNTDVVIMNLDFMQSDLYRKKLIEKNYVCPSKKQVNTDFLKEFCYLNPTKSIALSMTLPAEYFLPIQSSLYIQGLVFQFDPTGEYEDRNILIYEDLLSKNEQKGNLLLVNKLSANYLPMLLQLNNHYKENGNQDKLRKVEQDIELIGQKTGNQKLINELKNKE
jgi:hypothetical protein